jgi:nicotinate-nucleotide adenylyltransferase
VENGGQLPQEVIVSTVLVFGGSFNPPHIGHAMVVQWLRWTQEGTVLIVPAFEHPLGKPLAPFDFRVEMLDAMVDDIGRAGIRVSNIESMMDRPVYTYDLLTHLQRANELWDGGPATLKLVVGADILDETDKWHRWSDLVAEFPVIAVGRGERRKTEHPLITCECGVPTTDWQTMVTPSVRRMLPGPYAPTG